MYKTIHDLSNNLQVALSAVELDEKQMAIDAIKKCNGLLLRISAYVRYHEGGGSEQANRGVREKE